MSVLKFYAWSQKIQGRLFLVWMAGLIFSIQSCKVYVATETTSRDLSTMDQVMNNLDLYDFYVHTTESSFELTNPQFYPGGAIAGNLKHSEVNVPDSTWSNKDRKSYWKDHRFDIHIYCNTIIDDNSITSDLSESNESLNKELITIQPDEMEKLTITSIDREKQVEGAALIILIAVALMVATFLIVLLTAVLVKASSDEANESSGNSGSDSGSDSGSGDSGSGDSGSGGSSGDGGSSSGSGSGSGSSG